jgi:PucR C-terminal helix-turn-helix domain/GGDEF-like domain/Purine catabolism regulatory protein-like family
VSRAGGASEPSGGSGTSGPVTVREVLALLERWQPRLLAGESGLARPVSWASTMRARLPAFDAFTGGELALFSLGTLRALRAQVVELTLPAVVEQLAEIGVSAIAVAGLTPGHQLPPPEAAALDRAQDRADRLALPLIGLPAVSVPEIEGAVIAHVVARREQRPATHDAPDAYAARLRASLRGEALDALLSGTYAGEAAMRMRAAQLGYDLTQPHAVLWVELDLDASGPAATATAPAASPQGERAAEGLRSGVGAWAAARESHVAALVTLSRPERSPVELAERLRSVIARSLGEAAWSAGMGEPATSPAQVHRSAAEARDAARLGRALLGPGHVAVPADLGVYQLLLALRDGGQLAPFVQATLAPLLADTRFGDALVETLDAFFACNGNVSQAKERLHLHRNSLIYRLNRARELLGRDLDDPELRLALQLAIKGRRVLEL